MPESNITPPGVYIHESSTSGKSVAPVATAVPAFIGYTPQAFYSGKSYTNTPVKITSFEEFNAYFCLPDPPAPAPPAKQYHPQYYLIKEKSKPEKGLFQLINGEYYSILPDASTIYYMYNSIRLFYLNGGGDAYIVSVGSYGAPSGKPTGQGAQVVNPNVQLKDLQTGIAALKNEQEPTMYICPDATLLAPADNGTLMQNMLAQASEMQTAICILDIIGGNDPDPILWPDDIQNFRNSTGATGLDYGTAYYPFVGTTVMQANEIDYTNLFGGNVKSLEPILNPTSAPNQAVAKILSQIENPGSTPKSVAQNNDALLEASKTYTAIIHNILADVNLLPPSGGMAGVITVNDNQHGVWHSPANVSIAGVSSLPIGLSDTQQADLNVDAVSGKSVNAIRSFDGMGILVWGARTLDGNSQDWRYLSVRRTITFIEQSCKLAARAYVFEPNTQETWESVKTVISSFLTSIWKQGGLQGSSAADAFSVECGLGTTMTGEDILNGYMRVTVKLAVVHPAEFIVIAFVQQQATSS